MGSAQKRTSRDCEIGEERLTKERGFLMPGTKYSAKQMKLAQVAEPRDKLDAEDLSVLRRNRKKKDKKNVLRA